MGGQCGFEGGALSSGMSRHEANRIVDARRHVRQGQESGPQHAPVDAGCRAFDLGRPGDTAEELRRTDGADDCVAVAHGTHVVQTGMQQRRADTAAACLLSHADGADEAARSGVVAAEADQSCGMGGNEEARRTIAQCDARLAGPAGREVRGNPSDHEVALVGEGFAYTARCNGRGLAVQYRLVKPDQHIHGGWTINARCQTIAGTGSSYSYRFSPRIPILAEGRSTVNGAESSVLTLSAVQRLQAFDEFAAGLKGQALIDQVAFGLVGRRSLPALGLYRAHRFRNRCRLRVRLYRHGSRGWLLGGRRLRLVGGHFGRCRSNWGSRLRCFRDVWLSSFVRWCLAQWFRGRTSNRRSHGGHVRDTVLGGRLWRRRIRDYHFRQRSRQFHAWPLLLPPNAGDDYGRTQRRNAEHQKQKPTAGS